ncbi:MAG: phosphotransferase family protein [Actinomycetota bacterium]
MKSPATSDVLDLARLTAWLDERGLGEGEVRAEPITVGASNLIFDLRRGPHHWVLRRPPTVPVSPTAHDMVREFRVLSALEGTPVPHPTPLALCEDEEVIGARFYVMEFVDGFCPRDPLPPPFDRSTQARRELGFRLVDALADLATVDWEAHGLEGFGHPDGYLDRQVDRWNGQLERYRTRDIPHLDDVAAWLRGNVPSMGEPGIIHGDYQLINTLFAHPSWGGARPRPRLAAIVDWEQSTIGDPLVDLGWLLAGWHHAGEEPSFTAAYLADRHGFATRDELAERYEHRTGRSLEHLSWYRVLALFKLACVLEGHYAKFARGESDHPIHERFGELVLQLARQASELI